MQKMVCRDLGMANLWPDGWVVFSEIITHVVSLVVVYDCRVLVTVDLGVQS